jgi:hypothetical protein
MRRTVLTAVLLLMAGTTAAQANIVYVDTFDGGANPTGWNWNGFNESIPATGGNPDHYLANDMFFEWPIVKSTDAAPTPFHGDYAAAGVSEISFDYQTFVNPFGGGAADISGGLVLYDSSGFFAYTINNVDLTPVTGSWRTTVFDIPSQEVSLPADWFMPAGGNWANLITDVSRVQLHYLDPGFAGVSQGWSVGMDNASITYVPEPGALALVSLGGLALLRRRR